MIYKCLMCIVMIIACIMYEVLNNSKNTASMIVNIMMITLACICIIEGKSFVLVVAALIFISANGQDIREGSVNLMYLIITLDIMIGIAIYHNVVYNISYMNISAIVIGIVYIIMAMIGQLGVADVFMYINIVITTMCIWGNTYISTSIILISVFISHISLLIYIRMKHKKYAQFIPYMTLSFMLVSSIN